MSPLVAVAFANLRQWAHFVTGIAVISIACGQTFSAAYEPPLQLHRELPSPSHQAKIPDLIFGIHGQFLVCIEHDQNTNSPVQIMDLGSDDPAWNHADLDLGGSFSTAISHPQRGIVLIGKTSDEGNTAAARLLMVSPDTGDITGIDLPDFPELVHHATGVTNGNLIYVFGGQSHQSPSLLSNRIYSLNLEEPELGWIQGPDLPAAGRSHATLATHRSNLYLFGGLSDDDTPSSTLHDAWKISLPNGQWQAIADLPTHSLVNAPHAFQVGHDYLFIPLGGEDALAYHTITDRWTLRSSDTSFNTPPVLQTVACEISDADLEFSGLEVVTTLFADGNVSTAILAPTSSTRSLATFDWIAIAIYGAILLGMGLYFMRRERSTKDFFLGGQRVPWWAAGVSIFATQLSAITFMAIPAKSYDTNWILFIQNLGIFAMAPVVAYTLLPFFRRLSVTTAYEYLELRFHASLRLAGSAIYMLFQVGRIAVVTLLPALALAAVTGFDVQLCIIAMGILCIAYTVLGGIEAVIWSDVLQTVVLLGGALWALVAMVQGTDGGMTAMISDASAHGKLHIIDTSFSLKQPYLMVVILAAIFINIIPYASDQWVVQRYLTTPDEKSAKKSLWVGGLLSLPASLLFFALGTALWSYYRANPMELAPTDKLDQILPFFLIDQLPSGVAGLVIAGIFAAAMSSLDSSMNSVSTAFTTDFYCRFYPKSTEPRRLFVARLVTVVFGLIGTGAALVMAALNEPSLFDLWLKIIGLFGSGLAGLFILGIIAPRSGAAAAWIGLICAAGCVFAVSTFTSISYLLYAAVGVVGCVAIGTLAGFVLPNSRPTKGLTLGSMGSARQK